MRTLKQSVFDRFKCSAGKCNETCCKGWEIIIDDITMDKYKNYEGKLREILDEAVDYNKGIIKYDNDGKCKLLRQDGLCHLVAEEGEEALCNTCHMYPRHVEEYDGLREWSLSLSCPEAASLILEDDDCSYIEEDDDEPDPLADDFDDFDYMLFSNLEDSRYILFNIIKNRKLTINNRMKAILEYCKGIQELLDDDLTYEIGDYIAKWEEKSHTDEEILAIGEINPVKYLKDNIKILYELEYLSLDWEDILNNLEKYIGKQCEEKTLSFNGCDNGLLPIYDREKYLENLLMSMIYTYFLGAVYDDMIFSKAAFSVFVTITIDILYLSEIYNKKSDVMYSDEVVKIAREIEHSDENIIILEDYFYEHMDLN